MSRKEGKRLLAAIALKRDILVNDYFQLSAWRGCDWATRAARLLTLQVDGFDFAWGGIRGQPSLGDLSFHWSVGEIIRLFPGDGPCEWWLPNVWASFVFDNLWMYLLGRIASSDISIVNIRTINDYRAQRGKPERELEIQLDRIGIRSRPPYSKGVLDFQISI